MASCGMRPANQNETEELAKVCQQVAERSSRILEKFAQKQTESLSAAMRDEMGIAKAYMDLYSKMAADPALIASASMNLWIDQMRLWQSSWMKLFGMPSEPVAEPAKGDYRFKDEDWSKNFLFDYIKQSYLIASRHIQQAVASVQAAAHHHPALDQQVLHPRSAREELADPLGGRAGPHGVRDLLGESGRQARAEGLRRLHGRGAARGDGCGSARHRPARGQRHRLLPARYAARGDAGLSGGQR